MVNLRGCYMAFSHDYPADWDFLRAWQPSVVRIMLHGSHTDPNSVDVNRIRRVHETSGGAQILLRVWDVDDRNGEAHAAMGASPNAEAQKQATWWARLFDRVQGVPREKLIAGLINEPNPHQMGGALYAYTEQAMRYGSGWDVRMGVFMFSVGNPGKAGESQYDWPYFARLEPQIVAGQHAVVVHEYAQPEGMYAVWTDADGNERHDYGNLIGRHLSSGITQADVIIGEWGLDGLIFNRHPHPQYGNNGWLSFRDLWGPERYADEYVECLRKAAPNVIAICPFVSDAGSHQWDSFEVQTAYGALLSRKELTERPAPPAPTPPTVYIPTVPNDGPTPPTAETPEPQPPQYPTGIIDPRTLAAILQVESGGDGFRDKRLVIRFETHVFRTELHDDALWADHYRVGSPAWTGQQWRMGPSDAWRMLHTGQQDDEWAAFQQALVLDAEAACRSISMGAPQIMGFNHLRIGYPTATAMFEAFQDALAAQLIGLLNFVLSDGALADAVRRRDWRTVAKLYNGSGNIDVYAPLLEAAYRDAPD